MTGRCEPPIELQGEHGWHLVENKAKHDDPVLVHWEPVGDGHDWRHAGSDYGYTPEDLWEAGDRYLCPVSIAPYSKPQSG